MLPTHRPDRLRDRVRRPAVGRPNRVAAQLDLVRQLIEYRVGGRYRAGRARTKGVEKSVEKTGPTISKNSRSVESVEKSSRRRAEATDLRAFDLPLKTARERRSSRPLNFSTLLFYTFAPKVGKIGIGWLSRRLAQVALNHILGYIRSGGQKCEKTRFRF